jgi:hypothetical protein
MADQTFTSGQILTAAQMTTLNSNIGLAYIGETNATSGTAFNISNCFTTTYDSYRIVLSNVKLATTASISFTTSVSGAGSAANWTWLSTRADYGTSTWDFQKATTTTSCTFMVGGTGATSAWIDISAPRLAQYTTFNSSSVDARGSTGYTNILTGGVLANSTTYDGILFNFGATISSCKVTVYGYRQG